MDLKNNDKQLVTSCFYADIIRNENVPFANLHSLFGNVKGIFFDGSYKTKFINFHFFK